METINQEGTVLTNTPEVKSEQDGEILDDKIVIRNLRRSLTLSPTVYSILESLSSNADHSHINQKTKGLRDKYDLALKTISKLPGNQLTVEKLEELVEKETKKLNQKRTQLKKFYHLPLFKNIPLTPSSKTSPSEDDRTRPIKREFEEIELLSQSSSKKTK